MKRIGDSGEIIRDKSGKFVRNRIVPPKRQKKIEDKPNDSCCTSVGKLEWKSNYNMNQLLMNVCMMLAHITFSDDIDLKEIVEVGYSATKHWASFTIENFQFLEFEISKKLTLIYKIIGLTKIEPHTSYNNIQFQIVYNENGLVNTFNNWFSMGYHERSVMYSSSQVFGIVKNNGKYYLIDPNVQSHTNGEQKQIFEIFKCEDQASFMQLLEQCMQKNGNNSNSEKYTLIGVDTVESLTSLQLYVTDDPNYDKRRIAAVKALKQNKNILDDQCQPNIKTKLLKCDESTGGIRLTEQGRAALTARRKANVQRLNEKLKEEKWAKQMQDQHEQLNEIQKQFNNAYYNDRSKLRDLTRDMLALKRKIKQDEEQHKNEKHQREYDNINQKKIIDQKIKEYLQNKREYIANRRKFMTDEEREEYLKYDRERKEKMRSTMPDEEREEYLIYERERMENQRKNMTFEEMMEHLDKKKEAIQNSRMTMTDEEKKVEKAKSKKRYNANKDYYNERNQLAASIRKHLKFTSKKETLIQQLTAALGGDVESSIEAEQLININFKERQTLLNFLTNSMTSLVFQLKRIQKNCEDEKGETEKFLSLVGSSSHTSSTESYFVDSTYSNMFHGNFALSEDGKIMNLFTPLANNEDADHTKWECNEMCIIDQNMILDRLYNIIQEIVESLPQHLFAFFERINECPRVASWNKSIMENCDACDLPNLLERPMGHPHACYIDYNQNYGCPSILLFLRKLAPHYPFIRSFVKSLYKIRRFIKELKFVDTSLLQISIDDLRKISDKNKEKAGANFDPTGGWRYAHEDNIIEEHQRAFVALRKKILDVPKFTCISCEKLFAKSKVRNIDEFFPSIRAWEDLLDHQENNNNNYKFICDYCHDKFNKKQFPPTCILNNLEVRPQPDCITRLNDHEKILIQRAKAFQVVTRMGTVSKKKGPSNQRIQKVKGKTFHLPLPTTKTLEKLPRPEQAINPDQELYVLVRGNPTKQKQIWQSFVNIHHVYEALQWLKANNNLYKHIILPNSPEQLLDELNDTDAQFNFEEDNALIENEEAMITQKDVDDAFYENVTIHSLGEERPNHDPSNVYQMKNVVAKPIDNREKDLDTLCFPDLFCHGDNGMRTERAQTLTLGEFVKCKMMSVHSQFRLNVQYIFFLLNLMNINQIVSGIYTTLNTAKNVKNITVGALKAQLANKEFDVNALNIFNRLRNSSAFWNKPRNDINCMVRNYGPATWFLTLSPSEYHWEDLEQYLREIDGANATGKTASALIAMDPISTSRFIENKFQAMLSFLCSVNGPLGHVEHYAWRREYQSRGLQHFHLMIWIKDAPILGKSTNEEVSQFILKYASCHIPDTKYFPELHSRIMNYQQHYHNTYCQRNQKNSRGRFVTVCRFGFSRPITSNIVMRDVATSIHGRRKLKLKSRLYDLPRSAEEIDINDYNPTIMMAWKGNMDIQFIGEKSCALTYYITKYSTKAEKSYIGDGFSDISASKTLFAKLWILGQRILTNRECGSLEAADTLLQLPLFGTDKDTTIKWLDVRVERNRRLKDWKGIQGMTDDKTEVFCQSFIDTHYPNRPEELEDVCLFDYAGRYDIVDTKPKIGIWYKYGNKFVKPRKRPCLINHYNYNMEKNKEEYFHSLLVLFKPFRDETNLLGGFATYAEAFDNSKEELIAAFEYHEKLQELQRAKDTLQKDLRVLEEADKDESGSQHIVACDPIDDNIPDVMACLNANDAVSYNIAEEIDGLNEDQLRIFNNIRGILTDRKNNVPNAKVLRQFVSGVGGTGKSHLIKLIREWVKVELNSGAIVAAPTGIAAFNVQGLTIHRLLKLPVEHGSTPSYSPLSDKNLKQLRNVFKNIHLLIIDEISMVSNVTLLFIHLRLQEIFNTFNTDDGWFGALNILFFGDLLQLSPVRANCPFVTLRKEEVAKYHRSITVDTNLWTELLSYDELTINVRQKSDTQYADILSRIRLGYVTANDEQALRNRQLIFRSSETEDYKAYLKEVIQMYNSLPGSCLCLLSTKEQCKEFNTAILSMLPGDTTLINTKDKVEGRTNVQRKQAQEYLKKLSEDSSNTAGMEETLEIKNGCKVMLRRNIDAERGLVNGAVGTVTELIKDATNNEVSQIKIRFPKEEYLLQRIEVKFEVYANIYAVRSQFPITLAYGITIHKSQALSLESALLDIGNSVFCDGQIYVALSRLTSLEGVHIINFDPRNVKANSSAIEEYNRLRSLYRPDLEQIEIVQNKSRSHKDIIWWKRKITANPTPAMEKDISWLPGFSNPRKHNCFANSSLQCLLNFKSINRAIMSGPPSTLRTLTAQYNDPQVKILNSDAIISDLGFQLNEDNDAYAFIQQLSNSYTYVESQYEFKLKTSRICTTDSCTYRGNEVSDEYQYRMSIPLAVSNRALNIKDILAHSYKLRSVPDFNCPICHQFNVIEKNEIVNPKNILIFTLNLVIQETNSQNQIVFSRIPLKINSLPSTILDVCGSRYQLKSTIFFIGTYGAEGNHYMANIKLEDGWYCANDAQVNKVQWPRGSKNAYILFYEKK